MPDTCILGLDDVALPQDVGGIWPVHRLELEKFSCLLWVGPLKKG